MTGYDWFIILFAIPMSIVLGLLMLSLLVMVARDIYEDWRWNR